MNEENEPSEIERRKRSLKGREKFIPENEEQIENEINIDSRDDEERTDGKSRNKLELESGFLKKETKNEISMEKLVEERRKDERKDEESSFAGRSSSVTLVKKVDKNEELISGRNYEKSEEVEEEEDGFVS